MKIVHLSVAFTFCVILSSCLTVRPEDRQSWTGRPVADLEKHPLFLTMALVRTRTSDGVEIRNYLNSRGVTTCSSGGAVFRDVLNSTEYSNFANCMQNVLACSNLFYISNGVVTEYVPIGSGGRSVTLTNVCVPVSQLPPILIKMG
jgi:hypothetical protein